LRLKTNNIGNRLEELKRKVPLPFTLTKELVYQVREMFPVNVPDSWGPARITKLKERDYFYYGLNLLKILREAKHPTKAGFVYFLAHEKYPGFIKIGSTLDVDYRLKQYNTGCPFDDHYKMVAYLLSEDRVADERALHKHLANVTVKREWFFLPEQGRSSLLKLGSSVCVHMIR
jgi:hypothetical protein